MIKGYIHVAAIGNWKSILEHQIKLIKESGLYDIADQINLVMVGTGDLGSFEDKIRWISQDDDLEKFEFPTLEELYSRVDGGISFYIHLKGVSKTIEHMRCNSKLYKFVEDESHLKSLQYHTRLWRRYMEHFVIEKHDECIKALDDNDICGVHWRDIPFPHFSGNFWWAKDDYIARLDRPLDYLNKNETYVDANGSNRWLAEFWIGSGNPKVSVLFGNNMNPNRQLMLPQIYKKTKLYQ